MTLKKFLFVFLMSSCLSVQSQTLEKVTGYIAYLYVDPSDVVFRMTDKPSSNAAHIVNVCGTQYFHISRSNQNFQELFELVTLAANSNRGYKAFTAVVSSCNENGRAFISNGRVRFY